jgi:hypothetical protein
VERIIGNLDKVKLKLDEAFFYLDEIEELIEEEALEAEAGDKVVQAGERLRQELTSLGVRVSELQGILRMLEEEGAAE